MSASPRISDLTVEEFKQLLNQQVYDVSNRIVKDAIKPKQWLSGTEAKELMNCGATKLNCLVREGHIVKNKNGQYSRQSIDKYLNQIDTSI